MKELVTYAVFFYWPAKVSLNCWSGVWTGECVTDLSTANQSKTWDEGMLYQCKHLHTCKDSYPNPQVVFIAMTEL